MSDLAPLSDDEFPSESDRVRQEIEKKLGHVPNLYRVMAHSPDVLEATFALAQAVQSDLPPRYRELAFLKASAINVCPYATERHARIAESVGVTESQFESLDDFEESEAFDDREKAVLRFADQLTREATVTEETAAELAEFLDESQRVVLATTVGLANLADRVANAFGIETDEDEAEQ